MRAICLVLALMLAAVGCTRVEVHKNPDARNKGIRYYRPKPYLFISPGSSGGSKPLFSVSQGQPLKIEAAAPKSSAVRRSSDVELAQALDSAANGSGTLKLDRVDVENIDVGKIQVDELAAPAQDVGCTVCGICTQRPQEITLQMMYMPDFAEEYSIQLKPGLGVGNLELELKDGWNLTSVGIETDQQTDEIIASTAELIKSISGLASAPRGGAEPLMLGGKDQPTPICSGTPVYATNVPFGFYEAVIATDPYGKKQLYGWRYVGFMPFQACPVKPGGIERTCCTDCEGIYGLVWVNGILQFEQIAAIPHSPVAETIAPKKAD